MAKTLGPTANRGLGFWAQRPIVLGEAEVLYTLRGPLYTNPRAYPYPNDLRSWLCGTTALTFPEPFVQKVFRGPLYTNPRGHLYPVQLRHWIGTPPPVAVVVAAPFTQDDWPVPRSYSYPLDLRTIAQSFGRALIGLPPIGKKVTELTVKPHEFSVQFRTWTWQYNFNLIGQDVFPSGEELFDLPPPRDYPLQLRTWLVQGTPPVEAGAPFAQKDWPLPRGYTQPIDIRTIAQAFNFNLVGQDRFPPGEIVADLAPRGHLHHIQLRSWLWNYNLNLVGKDELPTGESFTDRPPLAPSLLQTWINTVNLALTVAPARPFAQEDWPLTAAAIRETNLRTWISQTKLLLAVPFVQNDWPLPMRLLPAARTWTWQYNFNLIGQDKLPTGAEVTALPPQPALSAIALRTWIQSVNLALTITPPVKPFNQYDWPLNTGARQPTAILVASYNKNLIGQDRLPFRQRDWPVPRDYPRVTPSWATFYNLNLIGRDQLPVGGKAFELPIPRDYPVSLRTLVNAPKPVEVVVEFATVFRGPIYGLAPRGHDYSVTLRSFFGRPVVLTPPPAVRPVGKSLAVDLPLQPIYPQFLRRWQGRLPPRLIPLQLGGTVIDLPLAAAEYPLQLRQWFGRIPPAVVVVVRPFAQTDWPYPRARDHHAQLRTWTWSYNRNLIGQDRLPVGKDVFDLPPQPPISAIQLRTWINTAALALITAPPPKPFAQYDWPLNIGPRQPTQIFVASYNKNLIAQDRLPTGDIVTDLSPRGPQQPTAIFVASYNKNLIGQDRLPTGARLTDLPPQPALSAVQLRTWIQQTNQALSAFVPPLPFNTYEWLINPGHRQPVQVFTASYNRNLIGQDRLPVGAITTGLPTQQRLAAQTWINTVSLVLTAPAVLPFNQNNWPLNLGPRQPDRSYGYVFPKVLIGKDRLPFRQMDWPLYRPFLQPAFGYTASYNRNLIGKDRLPFRQMDWPVPPEFRRLSEWIVHTDPNRFVPPPVPPAVLPRDPTHARARGGFELDARGASLDHRGVDSDKRGTSPDRRGGGRFSRGRNES
jgi:hypothetical protein